ncbi:hypothetical protein VCRA2119O147_2810001 [Vibrio crassostreae]|nr:hypothetical protein VCRA2119O147_2810001 [Vibrio crassostreae]
MGWLIDLITKQHNLSDKKVQQHKSVGFSENFREMSVCRCGMCPLW